MRSRAPIGLMVIIVAAAVGPAAWGQSFAEFDRNRDRAIQLDEFVARAKGQTDLWQRDFRLCDWNSDGSLTTAEFAACPALFPANKRGPSPDPMNAVRDRYVALFDQHWERWDRNGNGVLSQGEFIAGTLALSISPLKTAAVKGCDPDGNGDVTRDEASGVLERLLGYRSWNDLPLRLPNGQVVDLVRFRSLDVDGSGALSAAEVVTTRISSVTPAQTLSVLDKDRDGKVHFVEWCQATQYSLADPIEQFRDLDRNRDARLDADELRMGVPKPQQMLAKFMLPGFDRDLDGVLSLAEYRCCPLGNPVMAWHRDLSDGNGDGLLTFEEFLHDGGQFRLLAWEYFHQLDWNGDFALDTGEFSFHTRQADAIYAVREDGTGWRLLLNLPGYRDLESVAVSPNGQQLAFVRWRYERERFATASELCVCDLSSRSVRKLCVAQSPCWSPDGQAIACKRLANKTHHDLLVPLNGQERDHEFLSGVWSPDGTQIASVARGSLQIVNVATASHTLIFGHQSTPFAEIGDRVCWSPDGEWLCLRGTVDKSQQIVTVHRGGPELGYRVHDTTSQSRGGLAWHPRGDRIVFSKFCDERDRFQLYEFNPERDDPLQLFSGQDSQRNNTDVCWTPDGTTLMVISGDY